MIKEPPSQTSTQAKPFPSLRGPNNGIDVQRIGIPSDFFGDFYHTLLATPWWLFFLVFALSYLTINSIFASIYFFAGDHILNADPNSYWDAFFFSFQTSATIGYGYLLPKTTFAHIVVLFDTISGLLFVTIATGLTFAKLSRPTARVLFSNNIIIAEMNGHPTLMFRVGNARKSQIIDASIQAVLSKPETSPEGISMRRIYDLTLTRNRSPIFVLSWTVMHIIDESSPLYGLTQEQLVNFDANVIISISGIDDVFGQTVYSRHIYWSETFAFDKRFVDVMNTNEHGKPVINYRNFHKVV